MRTVQVVIGIVFLIVALIGCASPVDTPESPFVKVEPSPADLPGRYEPKPETVKRLDEAGYPRKDIWIDIRADGTYSANNMPDWWLHQVYNPKPKGGFESATGKWRLMKGPQDIWGLELELQPAKEPAAPGERTPRTVVELRGKQPPYVLHMGYGDPDRGEFMLFEKVGPPAANP
jgi:hypothetical protein